MRRRLFVFSAIFAALFPALRAQTSLPISLQTTGANGFNQDIIVGVGEGSPYYSNLVIGVFAYYEQELPSSTAVGLNGDTDQGLPTVANNRSFLSESDSKVQFQFAPYTGNNAFVTQNGNRTLGLTTPASYQDIRFLMIGQGGNHTVTMTLNFSDLTSTTIPAFTGIADWTYGLDTGSGSFALSSMGLIGNGGYSGELHLRQYEFSLVTEDQGKTLVSFNVADNANGNGPLMFFGASGTPMAIPEPSTYAAIFGALAFGAAGVRAHRRRRLAA